MRGGRKRSVKRVKSGRKRSVKRSLRGGAYEQIDGPDAVPPGATYTGSSGAVYTVPRVVTEGGPAGSVAGHGALRAVYEEMPSTPRSANGQVIYNSSLGKTNSTGLSEDLSPLYSVVDKRVRRNDMRNVQPVSTNKQIGKISSYLPKNTNLGPGFGFEPTGAGGSDNELDDLKFGFGTEMDTKIAEKVREQAKKENTTPPKPQDNNDLKGFDGIEGHGKVETNSGAGNVSLLLTQHHHSKDPNSPVISYGHYEAMNALPNDGSMLPDERQRAMRAYAEVASSGYMSKDAASSARAGQRIYDATNNDGDAEPIYVTNPKQGKQDLYEDSGG